MQELWHLEVQLDWQLLLGELVLVLVLGLLLLSSSSLLHDDNNAGPNSDNVKMGKAPFAAFLKNSRRLWSSSFFLFFSIFSELAPIDLPALGFEMFVFF